MDIFKLETVFKEYARDFNLSNEHNSQKLLHSKDVAVFAMQIAKSLNLRTENVELAYAIGLLHDIARFRQMDETGTFVDSKKFDHGDEALDILFREEFIGKTDIRPDDYDVVAFAVRYHNKYEISKVADEKCMLHARIVRDADKLDIFRQFDAGLVKTFSKLPGGKGMSGRIEASLKSHEHVDYRDRKTNLDHALGLLSFGYDLNFDYTKKRYLEKHINTAIDWYSAILDADDMKWLKHETNRQKVYLEKELGVNTASKAKKAEIK
jgi:putative nucleotidyltransferase with HDIG domain